MMKQATPRKTISFSAEAFEAINETEIRWLGNLGDFTE